MPILHDLQEVAPLLGGHGSKSPVVEDQKFDARQALEEPRVMAVAACQRERIEEPRLALIEDGAVIPTGLVAERAGNPTLADAGGADRRGFPSLQNSVLYLTAVSLLNRYVATVTKPDPTGRLIRLH